MRPRIGRALEEAYALPDAALAERRLTQLAAGLERSHPGAAASLREGLAETLTLQRLGVTGALYRTLRSTNAIENLNGLAATSSATSAVGVTARCSCAGSPPVSRTRSDASVASAAVTTCPRSSAPSIIIR
jgi:transposase-like protein